MVKPEWGTKRACLSCGAKFYDLRKEPIICPKCETKFEPVVAKPRRGRVAAVKAPVPVKAPVAVADDEAALLADDDDDKLADDGVEDATVLDDDDDDADDAIVVPVAVKGEDETS